MLIPDFLLLLVVLALAGWRLFAPAYHPGRRRVAVGFAILLAVAQWGWCGFTWQDVPAYLLLALTALPPVRTGRALRWAGRIGLAGLALSCVAVWILPAVPTLPRPDGRYPIGSEIYRWTDAARDEPHTKGTGDRRSVIAQLWYPAAPGSVARGGEDLPYIDGIGHLPPRVSVLPRFLMRRYGQIDTHAVAGAPLAASAKPWPVVILSPGYGAPRAAYTGLATQLASRGFVVVALDHPYEAAVTQLPGGAVVTTREILLPGERDKIPYMVRQQAIRAADIRFVIDQLGQERSLSPQWRGHRIDASHVAVIGHSFGGAAAIAAASADPRVAAAANIDGTPYGDLPDRRLTTPLLLLQSDHAETHHGALFVDGNGKLLAQLRAPGFHYEIKRANHFSFTDMPFYFAWPGRWLLARAMGGERGPAETQRATADIVAAFVAGPLTGVSADVAVAAARYSGVRPVAIPRASSAPTR